MQNNIFRFFILGIILLFVTLVLTSCGGGGNPSSPPPTNLDLVLVSGISATVLEYDDKITLQWTKLEDADLYKIYQYKSKTGLATFTTTEIGNTFDSTKIDLANQPQKDIVYYYKVTWMKNGIEYGKGVDLVKGLYSSQTDEFELNDSFSKAQSLTKDTPVQAITFALKDEANEIVIDDDYYKFVNTSIETTTLKVGVTISNESSFKGKLYFHFYNEQGPVGSEQLISNTENRFTYPGEIQPNEVIYFEIKPNSVSGDEKIGSYSITLID